MFGSDALVLDASDAPENDDYLNMFNIDGFMAAEEQFTLVPGLSMTLTVPPNATAVILSSGTVSTEATSAQEYSAADIMLFVDSHAFAIAGGYQRVIATPPTKLASWNVQVARSIGPGEHTFSVRARAVAGGLNATVSGHNRPASGTLTVMFLRS